MLAPPKPPSHDEPEALIKEARQRQLRRRMLGAASIAVAAAIGLGAYAFVTGGRLDSVGQGPAKGGRATGPLCRASQLSATAFFEGATGSMLGGAKIRSSEAACSLPSRAPLVQIVWQGRVMPVRQVDGMAVSGATPVRVLAPGARAFIYMQWREWCGNPPETTVIRPVFQLRFPGLAVNARAVEMSPPRCDSPGSGTRGSRIAVSRPLTD